jgi:aldose 1-epimerase
MSSGGSAPPASGARAVSSIDKTAFGKADGRDVTLYTLENANGLVLKAMTYGAIVTELHVPDRNGRLSDIVLGFGELARYLAKSPYFGATAGRLGNRIRDGKFELSGKRYALATNDAPHHLHGGNKGWDKVVWDAETLETDDGAALRFSYVSPAGEEGYPGTVTAHSTYTLTNQNEFRVEMTATTDAPTLVNMLHHSYWNLGGHDSGAITEHELTLEADETTPGDPAVPTGERASVEGTPFDFTRSKPIGRDLQAVGGDPTGYDHNFVVRGEPNALRPVARLFDPRSGRILSIVADQPGVPFYCGKFLDGSLVGKGGVRYPQYGGLCLETQKFPNSINVPAWAKDVILEPGRTYSHTMIHRFTTA